MNARSPGMTLAEVVVTALIGSFVLMGIHQTLTIQERSARHQRGIVIAQQGSRTGIDLLVSEIREISAAGGDLVAAESGSMTFRASRTLGFVCEASPLDAQIAVWQRGEEFVDGDSVFIFVDSDSTTNVDDTWVVDYVAQADSLAGSMACPDWVVGEDPLPLQRLTLADGSALWDVVRGSPVRAFTHVTYSLGTHDGELMLGRMVGEDEFVPYVGPLASNGVKFRYLDADGDEIEPETEGDREDVTRIIISVGALAPGAVSDGPVVDELATQLYLRNR